MKTIKPKNLSLTHSETRSFNITKLEVLRTIDDPKAKVLRVLVSGAVFPVVIDDAGETKDYTTLGQWTDDSLEKFLVQKLGLTVVENS